MFFAMNDSPMKQISLVAGQQDVPAHPGWRLVYNAPFVMIVDPQGRDYGCWRGTLHECEAFVEGWVAAALRATTENGNATAGEKQRSLVGSPQHVELWDAINRYVVTCGGDPSRHVYGNTPRMTAVSNIETALRALVGSTDGNGNATP